MTVYHSVTGEAKGDDRKKLQDSTRKSRHHDCNSNDYKVSSNHDKIITLNLPGPHLSNDAKGNRSGKSHHVNRCRKNVCSVPATGAVSNRTYHGPYIIAFVVICVAQAASIFYLHHQLNIMRRNHFEEHSSVHQQLARLMTELRRIKTDEAYVNSLKKLDSFYQKQENLDIITDDEEYDAHSSGFSSHLAAGSEDLKNRRKIRIEGRGSDFENKLLNFDYYFDYSGDEETLDDYLLFDEETRAGEERNFVPLNIDQNNAVLDNKNSSKLNEKGTYNDLILNVSSLDRPKRWADYDQTQRRSFRRARERQYEDQWQSWPDTSSHGRRRTTFKADNKIASRKNGRRRPGRGVSRKDRAVYSDFGTSSGKSLNEADTSGSYRAVRLRGLLTRGRGRKDNVDYSPVIDPSHATNVAEGRAFSSPYRHSDNFMSGVQRSTTHVASGHEGRRHVTVSNIDMPDGRGHSLLIHNTAPRTISGPKIPERLHNSRNFVNISRNTGNTSTTYDTQSDQATQEETTAGVSSSQDAPEEEDTSWLQLTSYSKIPYDAIEEFCTRTRASCPPGPVGPEGRAGERGRTGSKGETGPTGPKGSTGPVGPPGLTGQRGPPGIDGKKGDMGNTGLTGLDGRDGLPGEPGLDGIPGRNGLDGIPGVDGIPGFDGLPGRDGRNGTDGATGPQGIQGVTGDKGVRGLPGPRGRTGDPGLAGAPGVPGVNTWKVNGTSPRHLLIPPALPGPVTGWSPGPLVVREGDDVRMRCEATGVPTPRVHWRRGDGASIPTGYGKDAGVTGSVLNLTRVRRDHTGGYECIAYNGVPPDAVRTFLLEVHFEPFIQVKEWKVGAFNGSSARMECRVESFPAALTYWENKHGQLLENSDKYRIYNVPHTTYVWMRTLVLLLTNISSSDYGNFYCIAKNELAVTRGAVELYETDPRRYKPSTGASSGVSFGPEAPNYSELFGDLCPPQPVCEACPPPPPPVHDSGFLYCLNIGQFGNDTYPGFKNRSLDCKLSAIGKPVFNRHSNSDYGAWLRDVRPRKFYEPYYYATKPSEPETLYEYENKEKFRKDNYTKNYTLPFAFTGNSHVVYNGALYYHESNSSNVIKFDFIANSVKFQPLPLLASSGDNFLYTETRSYLDLAADENGIWAIYGIPSNNNTVVVKLEPDTLNIEYSWNISLNHHKFGEMFVTCGVLYGIDSATERETKIRFALDLYTHQALDVDLLFSNPFRKTTTLGYNPLAKELYSWDSGNQLNYPVVYIDIGYHAPSEDLGVLVVPEHDHDVEVVRRERLAAPAAVVAEGGQNGRA
ncbi:uncharacterized protein LOC108681963 [Hyalella azteca]|uniref:Uncharacterized protein LOC108681963 n=1 Tax=Hyalella azteca TaxID=294128 RepID=A0A979FYG5_HYAAZ|nr:uncharacterized protein LOC108681963 [Hyalella azteca]